MASRRRTISLDGFTREKSVDLAQKIRFLKASVNVSTKIFRSFSHLVCETLVCSDKFYFACAQGAWVLSPQYVEESYTIGSWLPEQDYVHSIRDQQESSELVAAAHRWRWRWQCFKERPFSDWTVAVLVEGDERLKYRRILSLGGANVMPLQLPLADNQNVSDLTYVFMSQAHCQTVSHLQDFGLICVQLSFITDTILKDEELDPFQYLIKSTTDTELEERTYSPRGSSVDATPINTSNHLQTKPDTFPLAHTSSLNSSCYSPKQNDRLHFTYRKKNIVQVVTIPHLANKNIEEVQYREDIRETIKPCAECSGELLTQVDHNECNRVKTISQVPQSLRISKQVHLMDPNRSVSSQQIESRGGGLLQVNKKRKLETVVPPNKKKPQVALSSAQESLSKSEKPLETFGHTHDFNVKHRSKKNQRKNSVFMVSLSQHPVLPKSIYIHSMADKYSGLPEKDVKTKAVSRNKRNGTLDKSGSSKKVIVKPNSEETMSPKSLSNFQIENINKVNVAKLLDTNFNQTDCFISPLPASIHLHQKGAERNSLLCPETLGNSCQVQARPGQVSSEKSNEAPSPEKIVLTCDAQTPLRDGKKSPCSDTYVSPSLSIRLQPSCYVHGQNSKECSNSIQMKNNLTSEETFLSSSWPGTKLRSPGYSKEGKIDKTVSKTFGSPNLSLSQTSATSVKTVQLSLQRFGFSSSFSKGKRSTNKKCFARKQSPRLSSPTIRNLAKQISSLSSSKQVTVKQEPGINSENTHSPIVQLQQALSSSTSDTPVIVLSSDDEEFAPSDIKAKSDDSRKPEEEMSFSKLSTSNNQSSQKQLPCLSSPTVRNVAKQISSLSSSKQVTVKQEPGINSENTHSPIVQLQQARSSSTSDTPVIVLSSDDEEFALSDIKAKSDDSKKSEQEMSFSNLASMYNRPSQKKHNPETKKSLSTSQSEEATSGHKSSALKTSFSLSPSVISKVRKSLASAFDTLAKKKQTTSNLQPTVELAMKTHTSECVSVVQSATGSSKCETSDSLNGFLLCSTKNNGTKLSSNEGYENIPGSSMFSIKTSEKAIVVRQSIPELYGQWMEAAQELGLNDSAISHGRPTQHLLPTPLVLAQLVSLAGEGNCLEEDVASQAVTYLKGWLNLHPLCNPDVARIYAIAFGLGGQDHTYLLGWIKKCALVPEASSDYAHFQALLSYFVSVLELNFNHCIEGKDKKRLHSCLVVSWLWENPLGVFHTSRTCQLVKLLEEMLQSTSYSPSMQVGYAAYESVCSLIGLAAECIHLASNSWDHSRQNYGSDAVMAIATDVGRTISKYMHKLSSEMVLLLLNFIKPSWLRAVVTAHTLSSSFNRYLLSDVIQARSLSLYIIVTQYFFLVPPISATDERKIRDIHDPVALTNKKKPNLQLTKRNHKGETVLHTACIKNNVELLEELLSQPNVEVNIQDAIGWTPLHEACNHGSLRCVELLLQYVPESSEKQDMIMNTNVKERLADSNSKYHRKTDISDSFVEDKKNESSNMLRKADLNAVGPEGITPLHDAVLNNHVAVCRLLLQYGGQRLLMARTVLGYTALDLAQTVEMVNVLKTFSSASNNRHGTETNYSLTSHDNSQTEEDLLLCEGGEKAPLDSLYAVLVGDKTSRSVDRADFSHFLSLLSTLFLAYCESRNLSNNEGNKTPHDDDNCFSDQAEPSSRESHVQDLPSPETSDRSVLCELSLHFKLLERHMRKLTLETDFEALRPQLEMIETICCSFAN